MNKKPKKIIVIAMLVITYVAVDILMDILLFPMLTESLQEHHKEIVDRHMIFFILVPVWIIGYVFFEKRKNKMVAIIFGSALVATVIFAFTSLPFIWIADTFPLLTSTFLFFHDYGLYIYFFITISIFGYKYLSKKHYNE